MDAFDKIRKRTTLKTKRRVKRNLAIANRIYEILFEKDMSQLDLANLMGKHASEISKWLTGQHNFEIKTIENIEDVLNEDIISVSKSELFWIPQQEIDFFRPVSNYLVSNSSPVFSITGMITKKKKTTVQSKSVLNITLRTKKLLLWQNNADC